MKQILLNHGRIALVDDKDYEWLSKFKWYSEKASTNFYAVRYFYNHDKKRKDHKRMHREILGTTDSRIMTDHIDRNGLNNQRSNLRICTQAENLRNTRIRKCNTSGYKGVSLFKGKIWKNYNGKVYRTRIGLNKKETHIGYFKSEIEAAKAYDLKAKILYGEFAALNFSS